MKSIIASWIRASLRCGEGFVVADEAAVVHEPADAPLDGPAPRDDREAAAARRAGDGLDVDAEAGAVVDGGGAVAGVHSRLGHARVGCGEGTARWRRRTG